MDLNWGASLKIILKEETMPLLVASFKILQYQFSTI